MDAIFGIQMFITFYQHGVSHTEIGAKYPVIDNFFLESTAHLKGLLRHGMTSFDN